MTARLAILAACAACSALATAPQRPLQVVTTTAVDYTGGVIHLTSTYGQLNVETWDEPRVEVTVSRTTFGRDEAYLKKIQVDVRKDNNGVQVTTTLPKHNWFRDFNLDYRIKVPRNANLDIRHGIGDVMIFGVDGDIAATVKSGDIVVELPNDKFAIDAKTSLGTVYSDFAGKTGQPWLVGQKLDGGSGHTVHLRSRIGGISLIK